MQCNVHHRQRNISACNIVTTFQRYQSCFSVAVAPNARRQRARAWANAAPHTPASVHAHRTRTHALIATVALRCAPPRSLERRERCDRRLSAMERRLQGLCVARPQRVNERRCQRHVGFAALCVYLLRTEDADVLTLLRSLTLLER